MPEISRNLLETLVSTIEHWSNGDQVRISYAYDGDGHFDFMGVTVEKPGRDELAAVLKAHERG